MKIIEIKRFDLIYAIVRFTNDSDIVHTITVPYYPIPYRYQLAHNGMMLNQDKSHYDNAMELLLAKALNIKQIICCKDCAIKAVCECNMCTYCKQISNFLMNLSNEKLCQ